MAVLSRDIGIDLGSSSIRVFVRSRGIVMDEPSVVAINKITSEVLAIGAGAREMIGKTPDNIIAVKPIQNGAIADFEAAKLLVENAIEKSIGKSFFNKPRVIVGAPFGINDVQQKALEEVVYRAGAKAVYIVEKLVAASMGASLEIAKPEGSMIIDIGSGTTEIAVISLGSIVIAKSIMIAGDRFNKDIIDYVKDNKGVVISMADSEEMKKSIASIYSSVTEDSAIIKGRNLNTGLPEDVKIYAKDIQVAISESVSQIMRTIKDVLEETPPELSSDVIENGIILTGGSSTIKNLDRYISSELGIPVHIAENPEDATIRGIGASLENIEVLKKALRIKRK